MHPRVAKRVVLAVSGGIAAYKAADLASTLVQAGAEVDTILTRGADRFLRPLTFQAITKRPVHTDLFEPWTETSFGHVTLAREADLLLVAPASANAIARLALGLADDLLGAVALSTAAPLLLAPAMEHHMLHHPATQEHLEALRSRGAVLVGPETGRLASGYHGDGRLAAVGMIVGACRVLLGRQGSLGGTRVVVTAAGTQEPLDPVRFLGNRSSGAMGYALAQAVLDHGGHVTLVTGPTHLAPPYGAETVPVQTALEMREAVERAVEGADALVMAAAVADFRPAAASDHKIKKRPGQETVSLEMVRNPDILAEVRRPGLIKVGFAAETEDLLANAAAKLSAKGLDMIVANDAVATIGASQSTATVLRPGAAPEHLTTMAKADLADQLIARVAALIADRRGGTTNRA